MREGITSSKDLERNGTGFLCMGMCVLAYAYVCMCAYLYLHMEAIR